MAAIPQGVRVGAPLSSVSQFVPVKPALQSQPPRPFQIPLALQVVLAWQKVQVG